MSRIGVFAGVFDPIHIGHTEFIKQAIRDKKLDKLYLMVEKEPRYKTCIAHYEHRSKMAAIALSDIPQAEIYEPMGTTFPITSTLPQIKADNTAAKIFLLLGDDVAGHINDWPDAENLLKEVKLVVAKRGGADIFSNVSSLKVRQHIRQGNTDGLDLKVLDYIRANNLY